MTETGASDSAKPCCSARLQGRTVADMQCPYDWQVSARTRPLTSWPQTHDNGSFLAPQEVSRDGHLRREGPMQNPGGHQPQPARAQVAGSTWVGPPMQKSARLRRRCLATAIRGAAVVTVCLLGVVWKHAQTGGSAPEGQGRALLEESQASGFPALSDIPVIDEEVDKCGSIINSQEDRCEYVKIHCMDDGEGILNFTLFHNCTMGGHFFLSFSILTTAVLLAFYLLGETAEEYFCPVVKTLTEVLDLAPNTAGVTFLAFGNGAPDVFSSLAAFLEGDGQIGLGAIVSAGSFVCAFVVGSVAIASAPFGVYDGYIRDIMFYILATIFVFVIFRNGEIHLWEASGLVAYYCFFVIFVVLLPVIASALVWSDNSSQRRKSIRSGSMHMDEEMLPLQDERTIGRDAENAMQPSRKGLSARPTLKATDTSEVVSSPMRGSRPNNTEPPESVRGDLQGLSYSPWRAMKQYASDWSASLEGMTTIEGLVACLLLPFSVLRRITIPDTSSYDKLQAVLNTVLCPLLVLLFFNDFIDFNMPVGMFGEGSVPLWSVVLLQSSILGAAQWWMTSALFLPTWMKHTYLAISFIASIAWISMIAQELLSCLSTLGHVMGLSPAIMGVTVLAWGNSIGDLVADVALARNGASVVALAGCYAGPMFNMLIGLGLALVIKTSFMYPEPYGLYYNPNVPISFGFLFMAQIGSAIAVPLSDYSITKAWGYCLVSLYLVAMVISILVECNILAM